MNPIIEKINRGMNLYYFKPNQMGEFLDEVGTDFNIVRTNKKIEYYNIPCAFDIETTNFYDVDGRKCSIMYEWTLAINFVVMIGRTWKELEETLDDLAYYFQTNEKRRLIIYIHNQSFEFQAIRKRFRWHRVFALDKRKVAQSIREDGIEFRCSYILSGYNLEKLGHQLTKYPVNKMVGDLNYDLLRHSGTPLTDKEIGYCIGDVLVVSAYIQELIERDGNISKIPLTKTGYVRNYCRNNCYYNDKSHRKGVDKYHKYRQLMNLLTIEPEEYEMLKEAFMGGFTHANPFYSRGIFHKVTSFDYTSAYPAAMASEKFPMSKGEYVKITNKEEFNHNIENYCCLFEVSFDGIKSIFEWENYIPISKCRKVKLATENNGRVVRAEHLEITITEQDFYIINNCYAWEDMKIGRFIRYKKAYLPTDFVKSIIKLYVDKTELKEVDGKQAEYAVSKENLNSCYGMTVTDICRDEIIYEENDEWGSEEPNIEDAINKYNKSTRRFLFYAWGIWVTAYTRYNLFTGIFEFKNDYIYSDTDSLKVQNAEKHREYIEMYNEEITYKIKKALEYHGIDTNLAHPKNKKGVEKPLGVWNEEETYDKFKTLGAKRYMTELDGKLSLTVSGLSKEIALKYMKEHFGDKIFENFDDGLYIPQGHTGKLTHTYIDIEMSGFLTDYLGNTAEYHELSGTHLEPADYDMSIARKYLDYLLEISTFER